MPDGLIEGTSILIALTIIIVVGSGNNYISEKRLAQLILLSDKQEVAVFRGGSKEAKTIDSQELLVGDIVGFEQGQKIPADMIMVEGQDVSCIEGELTGEPDEQEKSPLDMSNYQHGASCVMMAKALVATGHGKGMVLAVGTKTVAGVITEKTQQAPQPTQLQLKLDTIATKIGNLGLAVAVLTFFAQLVRILLEMFHVLPAGCGNLFTCQKTTEVIKYDFSDINNPVYTELLNAVIIAITVVVVAIPEGLPLAVTISLSVSSAQMHKR